MENLIFSLNATIPVFLLMVLGSVFQKIGWIDEVFATKMNTFVFKAALPVLVFDDLASVDFRQVWDIKFVLFCMGVTMGSILLSVMISFLWKDKSIQGEFVQASYRSSAALLGIAFIQNIYGKAGMAPLMIIGSVPIYNIMAVVVLSVFNPQHSKLNKVAVMNSLKGILTNPIIIGIVAGLLWSLTGLEMTEILEKTIANIGSLALPMGLMAMGATFDFQKAFKKVRPAVTAAFIKLVGLTALFLPLAISLGFRQEELIAILVMLSSATTVSCFVMAKNMGHEGTLTSSVVMLTTLFSAFTVTMWLFVVKCLGLI